uniref:N-terminal methionine N(alpha)-acetyltransferase NatC n=1 Tax=Syphacia muris TaxID=451379 RepID=A0A0N5A9I9_9BILA
LDFLKNNGSVQNGSNSKANGLSEVKQKCGARRIMHPPDYIKIVDYEDERQMSSIMRLISKDLSEPYSIYTYRYFIHNWPSLCFLALDKRIDEYVGAVVCKLDRSRLDRKRGYIAMLAVDESCRKLGIGTCLVQRAITNMRKRGCDEVVLETEVTNTDAMRLYSNLGFIREKRLFRYYLNGVDAFRLKLFFTPDREDAYFNCRCFTSEESNVFIR